MFFEHEGRVYASVLSLCKMAIEIVDVTAMPPKFITEVPAEVGWVETAKAALTTHNAIERARNAKPVEVREAVAA